MHLDETKVSLTSLILLNNQSMSKHIFPDKNNFETIYEKSLLGVTDLSMGVQ
jgi:hypothetical protein